MTIKILRLLQLTVYLVITSQLLFYLVILSDSLKQVPLENFLELRKTVDSLMINRFKLIYYTGLLLSLIVFIMTVRQPLSVYSITSLIALVCIVADVAIAMKGNMPINTIINSFTPGDMSQDWNSLRIQWLNLINLRGVFIVTGMISQLFGLIWMAKD